MAQIKSGDLDESLDFTKLNFARSIIIFLDAFLALMLIIGASLLFKSEIGRFGIVFGTAMLILTLVLRIMKRW